MEGLPSTHLDDVSTARSKRVCAGSSATEVGPPVRYFEQLYTFGDQDRAPGGRELAVAYLALARFQAMHGPGKPRWRSCYELFPWEDWRAGQAGACSTRSSCRRSTSGWPRPPSDLPTRRERAELTFGLGNARWDPVRVLDRYELAYDYDSREAVAGDVVEEAGRSKPGVGRAGWGRQVGPPASSGCRHTGSAAGYGHSVASTTVGSRPPPWSA